jgi:hypothetical protein
VNNMNDLAQPSQVWLISREIRADR